MLVKTDTKIALTAGLALFAMFFGAGNLVFPLSIGVHTGQHLLSGWLGFILAGVGLPFLGVFAISLYEGNYWAFFNTIGKFLSFLIITFLILIIGPLFGTPRTEDITYGSLAPFLPHGLHNSIFSVIYFSLIFVLSYKHRWVVDIIGRFISPVKLIAFITLIIASLLTASALLPTPHSASYTLGHALSTGYGTMDLLAAFFFCNVAYKTIVHKCNAIGIEDQRAIMKVTLKACLIGASLITLIYTGFMLSANHHAAALQHVATPNLINHLSTLVMGNFGSLFVCLCVSLACIATAVALVTASTNFFHKAVFRRKFPRLICLLMVLTAMYLMSILGFDKIMAIALPILNILYPCLIALCIVNISRKLYKPTTHKKAVVPHTS